MTDTIVKVTELLLINSDELIVTYNELETPYIFNDFKPEFLCKYKSITPCNFKKFYELNYEI